MDFSEIIKKYKPTKDEISIRTNTVDEILKQIGLILHSKKIEAEAVLVGSLSRGTSLRNSDIDIFITFSIKYSKEEMERYGTEIGFEVLQDGRAKYAEHPYVSGTRNNIKVDIVPCFKIEKGSKIISSVDRTPLHSEFLNSVLDDEMRDQTILLKLFLKKIKIYGSELKTEGFSGYVTELCIYYYKTFQNFLEFIAQSKNQLYIGEKLGDFQSPFVLIDPVDKRRNAASAVSDKSLSILRIASKLFLEKPSLEFFYQDIKLDRPLVKKQRGTYLFLIEMIKPEIIDDIIFPQIELTKRSITSFCERNDFRFMNIFSLATLEKIQILLELESKHLPNIKIHMGPPSDNPNASSFYNKYKNNPAVARGPYVKGNRIFVETYRDENEFKNIFLGNLKVINFGHNLNFLKSTMLISEDESKIKESKVYQSFIEVIEPLFSST
jgi:tRNA nucleotidyltransferase (CCA-adding enzyme)